MPAGILGYRAGTPWLPLEPLAKSRRPVPAFVEGKVKGVKRRGSKK
jgi:hypothetical protein